MRVCDYIAQKLYENGVNDVFLVPGGGSMFLTDGLACNENINCIPCLHEQGAAMAAVGYAHYRNNYGACFVTTGCGGTNTITGVLHAWQDHIPVIYVSGQCNRDEMMTIAKSPVRSIGQQEADIVSIVGTITKYAVTIMDPEEIVYHVEKALYLAMEGCRGPVWLDIPLDVQEAEIHPESQKHFNPQELPLIKKNSTDEELKYIINALEEAERPALILGAGVRDASAVELFQEFAERYQLPYVGTRRGWDILPKAERLHMGLADIRGNRSANMVMQNADCLIVFGSRLSMFTTGYNYDLFARGANKVIVVDINPDEHRKGTVKLDKVINADLKMVLSALLERNICIKDTTTWVEKCVHWKEVFPVFSKEQEMDENGISKFKFIDILNGHLKNDTVVVTDAGATTEIPMQALYYTTKNQRYIGSATQCEMGYAVPGVLGVSIARERKDAVCIVGDGSLQMNIQELQTIATQKLPVKIFVWNNSCYATIRGHQKTIFQGRYVGVDAESGTAFPAMNKVADTFGFKYYCAKTIPELEDQIDEIMDEKVPVLCDVICWKEEINPMVKAKYRREDGSRIALPPEDMFPPVEREFFENEMIIDPIIWWK